MAQRTGKGLFSPVVKERLDQAGILLSQHSVSSTNFWLKIFTVTTHEKLGTVIFFFFLNEVKASEQKNEDFLV